MIFLVLMILALFGATVWVVLDRSVTTRVDRSDRLSALCLTLSAVAVAMGVAYGLQALW